VLKKWETHTINYIKAYNLEFLAYFFIVLILSSVIDLFRIQDIIKKIIFYFLGFAMIIFASFRYGDRDYLNYIRYYEWINPINNFNYYELKNVEIGYLLLNSIYKYFNLNYIFLFATISLFSIGLFINYFKDYKYRFSALLIYFSHLYLLRDLMQIRAGLAANILLYSYRFILNRKFYPFISIVFLASLFHYAALIFIPFYYLYPWLVKNYRISYILLGSFILGFLLNQDVLRFIFYKLGIERINVYLTYGSEEFKELGLLNPVLIKNGLLFFMIYLKKDILIEKIDRINVFLVSIGIATAWLATFNNYSLFAGRTATFFSTIEAILLPCVYFIFPSKMFCWLIILIFSIIAFVPKFEIFKGLSFYFL
jgi:hypothetical protein